MQGAYLLMDSKGFNLEAASSPNYMGLTVTAGNERALIVGWDGRDYTLETESGRRLKTADYIWNYDDMADPDVMELNAKVAALRSEDSPYKQVGSKLYYNVHTGGWDALVGDTSLAKVALELDGDDFDGAELDSEDDTDLIPESQEPVDCCGPEMAEDLQAALEEALSADPAEMDELDKAFVDALPALLEAASDPDKDGSEDPAVQRFLELYDAQETDGMDDDMYHTSYVKVAFLPALAAGARMLLPAVGRGGFSGAAQGLLGGGGGGFLNTLTGGDAGPAQPVNVQRGAEYGYNQSDNSILARSEIPDSHFFSVREKFAASELIDIMREQVINALTAAAPNAKDIWGDHGDDLWYALMDGATGAKSIASLQSILQTLPSEFHTVPGPQGAGEDVDAPTPDVMGAGAGPVAPSADSIPVSPEPGGMAPGGDAGPTGLGGGELVPGGGLGPGAAPGGGIPGGPGRRAGSVKQASEDVFYQALAASPAPPAINQTPQANEQAELQAAVQSLIGQGIPVAQAYQQAALDYQVKQQAAQQSPGAMTTLTPVQTKPGGYGVLAAAGSDPNFVEQDGEARANMKCTECDGQSISYLGDDTFVCMTCGNKMTYKFKRDKHGSVKEAGEWPYDQTKTAPKVRKNELANEYKPGIPSAINLVFSLSPSPAWAKTMLNVHYGLSDDQVEMLRSGIETNKFKTLGELETVLKTVLNTPTGIDSPTDQQLRKLVVDEASSSPDDLYNESLLRSMTAKKSKWVDTEGKPLRVGGEYKMSHPDYPVADFVKVTFIEPESVRVGFSVNGHEDDLDDDRYEFEPLNTVNDPRVSSVAADLAWLRPEASVSTDSPLVNPDMFKEAGRSYNINEQRELIDEAGSARNIDKLNLNGTHYSDYDVNIRPENPGALSDEDVMLF